MMAIIATIESIIFLVLSGIHIYWAFGGTWGFSDALPTNEGGERVLNPKQIDSTIVGTGLLLFGIYILMYSNLVVLPFPHWIEVYGIWVIIGVFLLRAIGDFKYVGFFKRIRSTQFAQLDTRFYSPLCLLIASLGIALVFLK